MLILNGYKDIIHDFINSSNIKPPNRSKPIDKGLRNIFKSKNGPMKLAERDHLDKKYLK